MIGVVEMGVAKVLLFVRMVMGIMLKGGGGVVLQVAVSVVVGGGIVLF